MTTLLECVAVKCKGCSQTIATYDGESIVVRSRKAFPFVAFPGGTATIQCFHDIQDKRGRWSPCGYVNTLRLDS